MRINIAAAWAYGRDGGGRPRILPHSHHEIPQLTIVP